MDQIDFAWHPRKAAANLRKHGVSFEEAQTAFYDERALLIDDPNHSASEDRFVLLGLSTRLRMVVVVHAYLDRQNVIRSISARKANRSERGLYAARYQP